MSGPLIGPKNMGKMPVGNLILGQILLGAAAQIIN